MYGSLHSAREKQRRAAEHVAQLTSDADRFLKPVDRFYEVEFEPDGGTRFVIRATPGPPPDAALVLGDAIQCFRAALDHAVYGLSEPRGAPPRATEFPIFSDEADYDKRGAPRVRWLRDEHQAFVRSVQPFWEPAHGGTLEALNELANIDKHRTLMVTAVVTSAQYVGHYGDGPAPGIVFHPDARDPGETLLTLPPGQFEPGIESHLTIREVAMGRRDDVFTLLTSIAMTVNWVITSLEHPSPYVVPRFDRRGVTAS